MYGRRWLRDMNFKARPLISNVSDPSGAASRPLSDYPVCFSVESPDDKVKEFARIPRSALGKLASSSSETFPGFARIVLHGRARLFPRDAAILLKGIESLRLSCSDSPMLSVANSLVPGLKVVAASRGRGLSILVNAGD